MIPAANKIKLVDLLSGSGMSEIEVTSFVSPKWIPQLADAAEVMAGIARRKGTAYAVLTPNMQGFEGALASGADAVGVFGAASEGFSMKNINCTIAESLTRFEPVAAAAAKAGIRVRGYVSCAIKCPYDGDIRPEAVLRVAETLMDMGCYEISLGDTIGAGEPDDVKRLLDVLAPRIPAQKLAGHFHDTGGQAIANVDAALGYGVRRFDSAVGGLGGCPYAPGAKGNVATTPLVKHLHGQGYETGIDLDRLGLAEDFLKTLDFHPESGQESQA